MMVANFARWQDSTVPARVLAMVDSTLPRSTVFKTTGIGFGRDVHHQPAASSATMTTAIRRRPRRRGKDDLVMISGNAQCMLISYVMTLKAEKRDEFSTGKEMPPACC
jgi:hypothetical protein